MMVGGHAPGKRAGRSVSQQAGGSAVIVAYKHVVGWVNGRPGCEQACRLTGILYISYNVNW